MAVAAEPSSDEWTVSALYTYPVKSCQGVRLHGSQLTSTGLEYDRLWMLVDARSKRFVTQRQLPRLALVRVAINEAEQLLELSADAMPLLQLPLHPQPADLHDSVSVRVWYDMVEARRCGDVADAWVTQLVGRPTWMLYKDPHKPRLVSRYVPQSCKDAPQSGFADVFPLHVTTEPSLDDVNLHVPRPLSQQHFRPNIVLRSPRGKPYAEEEWTRVEVGPSRWSLFFTSRTPRCSMPNVDLKTGQMNEDREPMTTMRTFRCVDPGKPSFVCFGMQAAPQTTGNFIKVGDSVIVCERGHHALTEPL